jgi:hypothetical protein
MAAHKHYFPSVCGRAIHLIFLFQSHKKDIVPIPAARNIQLQPNFTYSFFFFRGQDLQGSGNLAGLTLPALGTYLLLFDTYKVKKNLAGQNNNHAGP